MNSHFVAEFEVALPNAYDESRCVIETITMRAYVPLSHEMDYFSLNWRKSQRRVKFTENLPFWFVFPFHWCRIDADVYRSLLRTILSHFRSICSE